MSKLDELVIRKNYVFAELESRRLAARALLLEMAGLERQIAEIYLAENKPDKASVNLVSQASCLAEAGYIEDAIEVYRWIITDVLVNNDFGKLWMENEILQLSKKLPGVY